jgi:hypothetical protein
MNLHTETNINDLVQHHFFHPSVHFTTKLDLHHTHSTSVITYHRGTTERSTTISSRCPLHYFFLLLPGYFITRMHLAGMAFGIRHRAWHGMAWHGTVRHGIGMERGHGKWEIRFLVQGMAMFTNEVSPSNEVHSLSTRCGFFLLFPFFYANCMAGMAF